MLGMLITTGPPEQPDMTYIAAVIITHTKFGRRDHLEVQFPGRGEIRVSLSLITNTDTHTEMVQDASGHMNSEVCEGVWETAANSTASLRDGRTGPERAVST